MYQYLHLMFKSRYYFIFCNDLPYFDIYDGILEAWWYPRSPCFRSVLDTMTWKCVSWQWCSPCEPAQIRSCDWLSVVKKKTKRFVVRFETKKHVILGHRRIKSRKNDTVRIIFYRGLKSLIGGLVQQFI